jgi:probable HAF family extracellular repeat protein
MRSHALARTLIWVLFITTCAASYPQQAPMHQRYKLVDLGTFGGPDSIVYFVQHILTSNGIVAGDAETNIPDPFAPNCGSPNCKVMNSFEWRQGVRTRLRGLVPGADTNAFSVNERGTVAGDSTDNSIDPVSGLPAIKATIWRDGRVVNLGTLGGLASGALAISGNDQVTGWAQTDDGTETHAFLWSRGKMRDLGTLGGPVSFGGDVNDRGQVVGFSFTDATINPATGMPTQHPFFWDHGRMFDLSLGGSLGGSGLINGRGQAIGDSLIAGDREDHAFLWSDGKVHDLGTLGGTFSQPTGLTEDTHISGVSKPAGDQVVHAVLWKDRSIHDLGTVDGDGCSWAWGLNSLDQVVGISVPYCDMSLARAFLWENGTMLDLNALIPANSSLHLVYGEAINDAGLIAGIGVPPGVSPQDVETLGHAFVLIPTAEMFDSVGSNAIQPPRQSPDMKPATEELVRRMRSSHRTRIERVR